MSSLMPLERERAQWKAFPLDGAVCVFAEHADAVYRMIRR